MTSLCRPPSQRFAMGYSMVELSVVVVIMGILAMLLIRTLNANRAPADRAEIMLQMAQAQQTIEAFILRNHRLPCASIAGDGNEACSVAQATGLPWRALGLPSNFAMMRYGVDRGLGGGADLAATPSPSISPTLVDAYPGLGLKPAYAEYTPSNSVATEASATAYQSSVNTALSLTTLVNGLDWCHGLRRSVRSGDGITVGSGGSMANVAYALAHPGMDGNFSGLNAAPRVNVGDTYMDSPARLQSADYDDIVWATGSSELLSRAGCHVRLAQALSSAQEAYAAYDNVRVLQQHWLAIDRAVETASGDVDDANTGLVMAGVGLAIAVASNVQAIASAVNSEGMTAFKAVVSAIDIVVATAAVVVAEKDLEDAKTALVDAKTKMDATNDYVARVFAQSQATMQRAILINQKGLLP
jgi:type II secretory pathway pseudopilin PulG